MLTRKIFSAEDDAAAPGDGTLSAESWIRRFVIILCILCGGFLLVGLPFSFFWLYQSGDLSTERAIEAQSGEKFALYGPGWGILDREVTAYKLGLYRERRPPLVIIGSSSGLQFRQSMFSRPVVNMAGTADSLSSLRAVLDKMLRTHKPDVILIGLDFWWFSRSWESDPFVERTLPESSGYSFDVLKKPWAWLLSGRVSPGEFCRVVFPGFREDRFGARAQFGNDGFGPEGSWYPVSLLTGKNSSGIGFERALNRQRYHYREYAAQEGLSTEHIDAFADIYFRIKGRGIRPLVFLAPVAAPLYDAMQKESEKYPHLFDLRGALLARDIEVLDVSDPRLVNIGDCEFLDASRMGEVASTRVLREFSNRWPGFLAYINMEKISRIINEWQGHAWVRDEQVSPEFEVDFLKTGCLKKTP